MKLELGKIFIKDIRFAEKTALQDGVLSVSKDDLREVALSEEKIKAVSFDIAKPSESVRITPVKDVIEPRVKVEGRGGVFPGVISGVDTVGSGKTYCLKGMAVVTARRLPGGRHRYERPGSGLHTLLEDPEPRRALRAGGGDRSS